MSVLKPRSRLVYFRVSEEEFRRCMDVCQSGGARSISDLARTAVLSAVSAEQEQVNEIRSRLKIVEQVVREMNDKLCGLTLLLHHKPNGNQG